MLESYSEEEKKLLNPPFCGLLLYMAAKGYVEGPEVRLPLSLSYLVLPIILHKHTRETLPINTRTPFLTWLNRNPQVFVGLGERARSLQPFSANGLKVNLLYKVFVWEDCGFQVNKNYRYISNLRNRTTIEVYECVKKSKLLGKWFSVSGTPATIYSALGIKP